jgi:MFS family permease
MAAFAWGLGFYGQGVYLVRLREMHGWTAGSVGSAITLLYLVNAAATICVGDVVAWVGARPIVFAGSIIVGICVCLFPFVDAVWQLCILFVPMGVGLVACGGPVISVILADWFKAKRGLAMSIAFNGASVAGIAIVPTMLWLTGVLGFATGLWVLVAAMWILLWPLVFVLLKGTPHHFGLLPDGASAATAPTEILHAPAVLMTSRLALMRSPNFQTITVAFALGLAVQVGFLIHQLAYLSSMVGETEAGFCVSLTAGCAIIGRIFAGAFIDRLDVRLAAAANFMIQIAALTIMVVVPARSAAYIGSALFGLGVGNMITFPALIIQREFSSELFSRVLGLVLAIDEVALAFGPGAIGLLRDYSGSYREPLVMCAVVDCVAAVTVMIRLPLSKRDVAQLPPTNVR